MITTLAAQNWGLFVLRGSPALALGVLAFRARADARGADLRLRVVRDRRWRPGDRVGLAAPAGPRWLLVAGGIRRHRHRRVHALNPPVTAMALVLLIGSFAIVRGVAEVGTAIWFRNFIRRVAVRPQRHRVDRLRGVPDRRPGDGALAVLFLIGFYALFAGVMYIAMGPLQLRRPVNETLHAGSSTAG